MPSASFTRPPAVKSPSPYARPTAPAFYFPPTQPQAVAATGKRVGVAVALALAIFLGLLGIHRIYVERTASGILMLLAAIANAVTIVGFGMLPVAGLAALGVWWVVDLFLVKRMVRSANRRRFA
ncbi:TM2 domain-containing protein [Agrococcus jejuensis]|uniref:TM2 domain-containing protein n=2 Tax=Agrococcus jejuensis TaxID=399736 RepID=A0A1G8CEY0_9MICO|nr:TM2 domain-containing protein [Agrococcus jejuensis]